MRWGKPLREAFPDFQDHRSSKTSIRVYTDGVEYQGRDVPISFDRDGDGIAEDGWFDISYQPVRDFDGKVSGVVSLSIDVTDRARTR